MDLLLGSDGDIVFINGACPTTYTAPDVVKQRLQIRLKTFLGEWFFDTSYGVPYLQRIFGKQKTKTTVDNIIREQILSEFGVLEILDFNSSWDKATRTFSLVFSVKTAEGQASAIPVNIVL